MTNPVPFWSNDVTILFNKEQIQQLWINGTNNGNGLEPSFEAKLNAISRVVILLTIIGFVITRRVSLIIVGVITLAIIVALYKLRKQQVIVSEAFSQKERVEEKKNMINNMTTTNPVTLEKELRRNFHPTTKKNPFGNVLLTDIMDEPERLAAAPSFNPDVYEDITRSVKKQTQMLNPNIVNTTKQIYGDLKDNYDLDNSMMRFYATANTRVCNDQGAFANYLYGNMPSGKSSGPDGALARVQDNYRYILI